MIPHADFFVLEQMRRESLRPKEAACMLGIKRHGVANDSQFRRHRFKARLACFGAEQSNYFFAPFNQPLAHSEQRTAAILETQRTPNTKCFAPAPYGLAYFESRANRHLADFS